MSSRAVEHRLNIVEHASFSSDLVPRGSRQPTRGAQQDLEPPLDDAVQCAMLLTVVGTPLACCAGGIVCDIVRLILAGPAVMGARGYHSRRSRAAERADTAFCRLGYGQLHHGPWRTLDGGQIDAAAVAEHRLRRLWRRLRLKG